MEHIKPGHHSKAYPKHSRTSCSDDNPCNADVDGSGCHRCNALMFDHYAQLVTERSATPAFTPTEQQYIEWQERHDAPHGCASREAFEDAASLYLLAASRVPVAQEDERKAFEADIRKRNCIPDYVDFASLNPVVTSEAWAAWQARAAIASQGAEPVEYQYRMRGDWQTDEQWGEWTHCTAAHYESCVKSPHVHNWRYEARKLYTAPPAAAPAPAVAAASGINYAVVQKYADKNGLQYNSLCSMVREAIAAQPAPAAQADNALRHEIQKLTHWKHCMSYSDSYFGEPAGLMKRVAYALDRLLPTAAKPAPPAECPICAGTHLAFGKRCDCQEIAP
jgi:hypothetical protein